MCGISGRERTIEFASFYRSKITRSKVIERGFSIDTLKNYKHICVCSKVYTIRPINTCWATFVGSYYSSEFAVWYFILRLRIEYKAFEFHSRWQTITWSDARMQLQWRGLCCRLIGNYTASSITVDLAVILYCDDR